MRKLSIILLVLLAACAPPPPRAVPYRTEGAPIYSIAGLDPARLAGNWHEVAGFYDPAQSGCAVGLTQVTPRRDGGLSLTLSDCTGLGARTVTAAPAGASGRFRADLHGPLGEPWWVLWIDADNRAMVIGTPSGHFGAILSRTPVLRPDLMEAARQLLDFNGYDVKRLRPVMR